MKPELEKLILGQRLSELTRQVPTAAQTVKKLTEQLRSNYPMRTLGWSDDGEVGLAEEQYAAHTHILGTTREGKSKLLEKLIRQDIDQGYGATLLDPSDNGQTCYDILRYCVSEGIEKVCLIDPHDAKSFIPCINPLAWRGAAAVDSVVSNLMDSTRVLWGQAGFESTPRIEEYLYAMFTALYMAKATIPDAQFFRVKDSALCVNRRQQILSHLHPMDNNRILLESVFNVRGQELFIKEFQPSIRRLSPFFRYLPKLIFGSTTNAIDFKQLVSQKWVILMNLDKTRVWGPPEQRVLGTLVINEIVNAVYDLNANGWKGRHYLYIDEVGQYATRVLHDLMAYKGKSGLWVTVAHQFFAQVEDKVVLNAIENLCKIKIMFSVGNTLDRQQMTRNMYTSDLKTEATDASIAIKKQYAVIKINKNPPVTTRIDDVHTPHITEAELDEFKNRLYKLKPEWYRSQADVLAEISNRFAKQSPTTEHGATSGRQRGRRTQSHIQEPAGHDENSVVESLPMDVQEKSAGAEKQGRVGNVDVGAEQRGKAERKKGNVPRVIPEH